MIFCVVYVSLIVLFCFDLFIVFKYCDLCYYGGFLLEVENMIDEFCYYWYRRDVCFLNDIDCKNKSLFCNDIIIKVSVI